MTKTTHNKPLTGENQERIWKHFQNEAAQSFEGALPRLDFLAKLVKRLSRSAQPIVLNIGVGNGHLERKLLAQGWQPHALDPDSEALAKLASEGVVTHVGYIDRLPMETETYDFVIASEVLEHLTPSQRSGGLAEIARVLKPGGWFLGTVPHDENLLSGQVVCPDCGVVFHRWGHFKSFTLENMKEELTPHFSLVEVRRTAFVSFSRGILGNIKSLVRVLLAKWGQPIAVPSILWQAQKR